MKVNLVKSQDVKLKLLLNHVTLCFIRDKAVAKVESIKIFWSEEDKQVTLGSVKLQGYLNQAAICRQLNWSMPVRKGRKNTQQKNGTRKPLPLLQPKRPQNIRLNIRTAPKAPYKHLQQALKRQKILA